MQYRLILFVSATICALGGAFGQTGALGQTGAFGQTSVSTTGFSGSASFSEPAPFAMVSVNGAPYSGEQVNEQIQILADGTRITRTQPATKIYRDSNGRTRTERPMFRGMPMAGRAPESPVVVEITDPVAQVKYTLDTANKVAHRQRLPSPPNMAARSAVRGGVPAGINGGAGAGA